MNTRVFAVVLLALFAAQTLAADTEVAAKADTEVAAAAEAKVQAAAAATATATTTTTTTAATETTATAAAESEADKPKKDAAKKADDKSKPFKPVMIRRNARILDVSQRADVHYTDGGIAKIINFGPRRQGVDTRIEADIASPLERRFAWWAARQAEQQPKQKKYITPTYADEMPRRSRSSLRPFFFGGNDRYVSVVPSRARSIGVTSADFVAKRVPTHFEPEYADQHHFWNAFGADSYGSPKADLFTKNRFDYEIGVQFPGSGAAPTPASALPTIPPLPTLERVWAPAAYDSAEWSAHPNRFVPSAHERFGLPSFPAMPASAAVHIANAEAKAAIAYGAPFSGWDDTATGADWDSSVTDTFPIAAAAAYLKDRAQTIQYPNGRGPKASLAKLDFALSRLESLNAQLKAAEQKVATTRAGIAANERKIKALNQIRSKLSKLASQISSLEGKVGSDPAVQREIIAATYAAPTIAQGIPVMQW